jgi:hypothetical protein
MAVILRLPGLPDIRTDNGGDGWSLMGLEGWDDTTEPRLVNEARVAGDGDLDEDPIFVDARYVIVSLAVGHRGRPDLTRKAQRALRALGSIREDFRVEIEDEDGPLTASMKLASKIRWDYSRGMQLVQCEFSLKADDPRRYSREITATTGIPLPGTGVVDPITDPFTDGEPGYPGQVVLANDGDASTTPNLLVSGGLSQGFEIIAIERNRRIRLDRPVPEGSTVTIDMRRGQAWIDGVSPISLTVSEWWTIRPGETVTLQFVPLGETTGDPELTAIYSKATN